MTPVETITLLKRLAVMCLVAGSVYANLAGASESAPEPDPGDGSDTAPIAQPPEQDEHNNLPSRFAVADVHPSEGQVDASETAQAIPLGPQYSISRRATLGGWLQPPDMSGFANRPDADRYVFGLHRVF